MLLPSFLAAAVTGFLSIVTCVSYPTVIFSGPLEGYLATGIGIAFVSAVVINTSLALFGTMPGAIGYAQSEPIVLGGIIAASMTATLQSAGQDGQILPTVISVIWVSAVLCGIFFVALGHFQLGNLIRYIPYPVMGGFLGGIGWLLLKGVVGTMRARPCATRISRFFSSQISS